MDIHEYLNSHRVFKIVDNAEVAGGLKVAEQLDRFIDVVQQHAPVLDEASMQRMKSYKKEVAAIDTPTGYLYPGRVDGTKIIPGETAGYDEFSLSGAVQKNELDAREFVLAVTIDYDTLEDTIEGPDFEGRIVSMLGQSASLDLEKVFLLGDTGLGASAPILLKATDGWVKLAGGKVYGYDHDGVSKDFDPTSDAFPIDMFDAMLEAIDKRYLIPRNDMRFYVDWSTFRAYREQIAARETVIGDEALLGQRELTFDGIPVVHVPNLDDKEATAHTGRVALLARPTNMIWGVYREITVESQRHPKKRQVEHVLTMRADCTYADVNGAVAAFITQAGS